MQFIYINNSEFFYVVWNVKVGQHVMDAIKEYFVKRDASRISFAYADLQTVPDKIIQKYGQEIIELDLTENHISLNYYWNLLLAIHLQ